MFGPKERRSRTSPAQVETLLPRHFGDTVAMTSLNMLQNGGDSRSFRHSRCSYT